MKTEHTDSEGAVPTRKPDPFETTEERNWPEDYNDENGNYVNRCLYCEKHFRGHKYRRICKLCDAGSIEYWTKLSQTKKPEDNKCAHAGCWSQGEMTGYARCMVKEVFPLRAELATRPSAPDKGEMAKAQERVKELESLLRRAVSCFSYHSESASDLKAEINRYLKP